MLNFRSMKKIIYGIISLPLILIFTGAKMKPGLTQMTHLSYTYLALGDSYTIGESVLPPDNFPAQTVKILKEEGFEFHSPEIIAKTGWTTDELQQAIDQYTFSPVYDFVTLLIGVNNQYRGRKSEEYKSEFEHLLKQSIQFAGGKIERVTVLCIPDWGVTPFAKGRDRKQIAKEIDEYNAVNKMVAAAYGVNYLDITEGTREAVIDPDLLATDGLHPSAKEYARWAKQLAEIIKKQLL